MSRVRIVNCHQILHICSSRVLESTCDIVLTLLGLPSTTTNVEQGLVSLSVTSACSHSYLLRTTHCETELTFLPTVNSQRSTDDTRIQSRRLDYIHYEPKRRRVSSSVNSLRDPWHERRHIRHHVRQVCSWHYRGSLTLISHSKTRGWPVHNLDGLIVVIAVLSTFSTSSSRNMRPYVMYRLR